MSTATEKIRKELDAINERFAAESLDRYCRLIDHETKVLEALRNGEPVTIRKPIRIPIMVAK